MKVKAGGLFGRRVKREPPLLSAELNYHRSVVAPRASSTVMLGSLQDKNTCLSFLLFPPALLRKSLGSLQLNKSKQTAKNKPAATHKNVIPGVFSRGQKWLHLKANNSEDRGFNCLCVHLIHIKNEDSRIIQTRANRMQLSQKHCHCGGSRCCTDLLQNSLTGFTTSGHTNLW